MPQKIYVALGANLPSDFGQPEDTVRAAVARIKESGVKVIAESSFYRTPAWPPGTDQPDFINAVVEVESDLSAPDLIKVLHNIELDMGRTRLKRWEARVIDLDLIAYDRDIIGWPPPKEEGEIKNIPLCVPHARMHERLFVLEPLAEISADWVHPWHDRPIAELIAGARRDNSSG